MKKLIILSGVSADQLRAALNDPQTPKKDGIPIVSSTQEVKIVELKKK